MHELCKVNICNYDSLDWKQTPFGESIPKKFAKMKILHLLGGIMLWRIWIERNDKVFNNEQCHGSKMKHLICHVGGGFVCAV